jgi:hypothetical protein
MYTNQGVSVDMRIVGKLVLVDLHGSGDALQLAFNDLANRFELLIEAGALKWSKARADHFVLMPQSDWTSLEVISETKRQLRL